MILLQEVTEELLRNIFIYNVFKCDTCIIISWSYYAKRESSAVCRNLCDASGFEIVRKSILFSFQISLNKLFQETLTSNKNVC